MRRQMAEGGSATVEFALVLPLFALLLLGLVEFGLAIWHQEILTNACREGARAGIVSRIPRPTEAEISAVVETYLASSGIDLTATTISVECKDASSMIVVACSDASFEDFLTVALQYPHSFFVLPNLMSSLGSSLTLQAKTVMLLE